MAQYNASTVSQLKGKLNALDKTGVIWKVTSSYVRVSWYSPRVYFIDISARKVKRITRACHRKIERKRVRDIKRVNRQIDRSNAISDALSTLESL